MATYDPQLHVTFGQLRAMGLPFPVEIPDDAWVPKRCIKAKMRESTGHIHSMTVVFSEPIRRGKTTYRIQNQTVVTEEEGESAANVQGP